MPHTGITWCECGQGHELTRCDVASRYAAALGGAERVPHAVVVAVTRELWGYDRVCRFFHLNVEDAARAIVGNVLESYSVRDAIDITGEFSRTRQGCPEESCQDESGSTAL